MNASWSYRCGGLLAIFGVVGFTVIVLILHVVQADHDPSSQLMSELALGTYGWSMALAFFCLALSMLGLQMGLGSQSTALVLRLLLFAAALCFLGAGVFPLGKASQLHIVLVATAFVLSVLAMYIYPSLAAFASRLVPKWVSWGLAASVALSVALGQSVLPMGIGQRLAAAFLLTWLAFAGWKMARSKNN